jgi:putative NIF3 family GTP cyclohydrolase 1 type 2
MGIEWRETVIDDFLYGDPDIELKNIAAAMMATQDVLEKAVKKECNLIITHEPLFYNHHHKFENLLDDAVYKSKEAYLRNNRLCVFHLHDNLHNSDFNFIDVGMAKKLDWEKYRIGGSFKKFRIPEAKLERILGTLNVNLQPTAIKYVGDKDAVYENVVVSWGFLMMENGVKLINSYENSVLITGETHEWEFVEYVHDATQMGFKKALIIIGHIPSEACGVEFFCNYLQEMFPARSIFYIKTNDLFKM